MKTLLLNSTYQPISFVSERKTIKLFVKEKVEILSVWDNYIHWTSGKMQYPAIVRLKYYVKWLPKKIKFSRKGVFQRDRNTCQYCGRTFKLHELTLDHVLPRSKGGKTEWNNCVTSCLECNTQKSNRTLEEIGMKLLKKPTVSVENIVNEFYLSKIKHPDWAMYLGINFVL